MNETKTASNALANKLIGDQLYLCELFELPLCSENQCYDSVTKVTADIQIAYDQLLRSLPLQRESERKFADLNSELNDERADEKGVDEDEDEDEVEENYDAADIRHQQKAAKKEIDRESAENAYKITKCIESYYKDMQMLVENEISICEHFNLSSQEMSMRRCARVMAQLRAEMMKASAEIVIAIAELNPKRPAKSYLSLLRLAADKSDAIRRSVFARLTALEENVDEDDDVEEQDDDEDVEDDDEQESRTADVDETCTNYGHEQTASPNEMNYHESDSDSDSDSDEYGSLSPNDESDEFLTLDEYRDNVMRANGQSQ